MSDTPRVDALLLEIDEGRVYETDGPVAEFARQLERELASLRAVDRNAVLEEAAEVCDAKAVRYAERYRSGHSIDRGDPYIEGKADCADELADQIRALKDPQEPKPRTVTQALRDIGLQGIDRGEIKAREPKA